MPHSGRGAQVDAQVLTLNRSPLKPPNGRHRGAIWRIDVRDGRARDGRVRIALYQPDIPQNTGTILRLAACFAVPVDVIGPAGFDLSDRGLRRAGLDYLSSVELTRHQDWPAFEALRRQ